MTFWIFLCLFPCCCCFFLNLAFHANAFLKKGDGSNCSHLKEQPCYFWVIFLPRPKLMCVYDYDKDQLKVHSQFATKSKYQYWFYYRCCLVQALRKMPSVWWAEDQPLLRRPLYLKKKITAKWIFVKIWVNDILK